VEVFGNFLEGVPAVMLDNFKAGEESTRRLLSLGHRRIAMLTHDRYSRSRETGSGLHHDAWERYQGYAKVMEDMGLKPMVFTHPLSGDLANAGNDFLEGGVAAAGEIISHPSRPTAVVCYQDSQAFGLLRGCRLRGVHVPEDLSVMGFGDKEFAALTNPPLTTISAPAFEVGREATMQLLALLEGRGPVEGALLGGTIVERASLAAPTEHP